MSNPKWSEMNISPGKGFGNWKKPFVTIGHSGAGAYAPENTLKSLALALEMGAEAVEFDVRRCLDGLVLLHDDNLARFQHASGLASQKTCAELQELDAGEGERIPTLTQALDLIKGKAVINIDMKACDYEAPVIELVKQKDMLDDILFSSLYPASLRMLRQIEPKVITGISYPEDKGNASKNPYLSPIVSLALKGMKVSLGWRILQLMAEAQANAAMIYYKLFSQSILEKVHRTGGKLFLWTVDDRAIFESLRKTGVDGIASNRIISIK
jgi:glycerophosphoryl diester phosphodiesterase